MLEALGHHAVHVVDTPLSHGDDGFLVRNLREVECEWLLTLDQHRQPEVWSDVYTALADGVGRLLRIRPVKTGATRSVVASLARYVVDAYDNWSLWLDDPSIRLIDLGRGKRAPGSARLSRARGSMSYAAYTTAEVAGLMQQQLGYGGGPRVNQGQSSRRGRASG